MAIPLDPLSVLVGVPVLGPVVAWLFKELRDSRIAYDQQLGKQRDAHVSQVDRHVSAYQDLAGKVQDHFSAVVTANTSTLKALEKSIDGIVERVLDNPPRK